MKGNNLSGLKAQSPKTQIIAVGTELLSPTQLDTNSLFITQQLNLLGIQVTRKSVVGDREEDISNVLMASVEHSELVFVTGGLGPTKDDITREVTANLFKRKLVFDPLIMESIEIRARKFGLRLTKNNRRQAMVPEEAEVLFNFKGTAPGLLLNVNGALLFLLPGPPRELKPMVAEQVVKILKETFPVSVQLSRHLAVAAMPESRVDAMLEPIYCQYPQVQTTILSSPGIINLHFSCSGSSQAEELTLEKLIGKIRTKLGKSLFTETGQTLPQVVGGCLKKKGLSLATAESCTGGLLGKLITDIPGSSDYFRGGVVTYSNDLKELFLGLPTSMLQKGVVSDAVACYMARSIRDRTGASVGLSVTGIAGPGGGTDEKPVGLVFLGLCQDGSISARKHLFPGGRKVIRRQAALYALDWLRRELM